MWAVGSIGIVIERGGWAGFGPWGNRLCCFKRHLPLNVLAGIIQMQKEYSTAVLNGPKLDQSSAQNLICIKVQKDIVIQYSQYAFDILLILVLIF